MDIIRVYKSNKNMTETERKEHIRHLANERQKKLYRKKKMEQIKLKQQQAPKITIQKINLDEEDKEEIGDEEFLVYLLENVKFDNSKEDNENLELIDILEDKLGIDEDEKLNAYDIDNSDSSYSSDSD